MSSINRLKRQHGYKYVGDGDRVCRNCTHFKRDEAYEGIPDMRADLCMYFRDTDQGSPVILAKTGGVCEEFK